MRTLRRSPYAAARLARSEARVASGSHAAAELDVEIDSGPRFSIGPLEVQGLKRYPRVARRELQHPEARRAVHRSGDGCVRASPRRQRLFRERAGVDRCGVRQSRRCDGARLGRSKRRPIASRARCRTRPTRSSARARATRTSTSTGVRLQMRLDGRFEVKQELAKVAFTWPPTASKWLDSRQRGRAAHRLPEQRGDDGGRRVPAPRRGRARASAVIARRCSTTGRCRSAPRRRPRTRPISRPVTCSGASTTSCRRREATWPTCASAAASPGCRPKDSAASSRRRRRGIRSIA